MTRSSVHQVCVFIFFLLRIFIDILVSYDKILTIFRTADLFFAQLKLG